jgi:hypothetical protein
MKPTVRPRRSRKGMGITFYVVRNSEGQFLPVHVVPDAANIATITPLGGVQSDSEDAS